jgi:hypothetical protein
MRKRFRIRRPSASMVVAMIALFVALAPAAYATHLHVVRSEDIVDGEVKNPDIGADAVGSGKVIDDSLMGVDIRESTLAGLVRGNGTIFRGRLDLPKTDSLAQGSVLVVPGFGSVRGSCSAPEGLATFKNDQVDGAVDVWSFNKDQSGFSSVMRGNSVQLGPVSQNPVLAFGHLAGPRRTAFVSVAMKITEGECIFSAQAVAQISP